MPLNVRYVTTGLSGSNREVDFQTVGFNADVSAPMQEPDTSALMVLGALGMVVRRRHPSTVR